MELYHFTSEKYGLEAIGKQRLKASTLDNLNDPFELFAIDTSSSNEFYQALKTHKSYLSHKWCFLCFSKTWESPLLWSHYAERHKGMALVFEVPEIFFEHIKYQKQRIKINEATVEGEDTTRRLLTTKYIEWAYEKEARVFRPVSDVVYEANLPFVHFDRKLALKSVVLGPLSKTTDSQIEERLPQNVGVSVIRSCMALKTFHIVRNEQYPIRQILKVPNE